MSVQLMDFRRDEIATLGKNVARSRLAGRLCLELLHKAPPSTDQEETLLDQAWKTIRL